MREAERDYGRLIDILEAADNILTFTKGYTMEQLNSDKSSIPQTSKSFCVKV